ncbi:unnamed protein product, partial [Auanema sp. JU1783]
MQYLGRSELYATVRANIRYLNSQQLLEQIGQRINVTEFDSRMLTALGETYREKAEFIAKDLTFTPGPVTDSLSVPKAQQVLQAFMGALPAREKKETVNSDLLNEAKDLARNLLSLKMERFNAELANTDDARFEKLNLVPDNIQFDILTRSTESNYGMNYTPDPSFTSPDQVSRKTLLRV